MEEASASSPRVNKALSFMSSDDDDQENDEQNTSSDEASSRGPKASAGGSFRFRTRREERLDVYHRQDPPYHRRVLPSPSTKTPQRRSSSEQSTPTSHRRHLSRR
jgi:hypothetical protein